MNTAETEPCLTVTDAPDDRARAVIADGLAGYNYDRVAYRDFRPLAVLASDPNTGEVIGGLSGADVVRPALCRAVFPARSSSRQRARQPPHCLGGRGGETARLHARRLVHADLSSAGLLSQAGLRGRRAVGVRPTRRDTYADDQEALRKRCSLFSSDNHALSCSLSRVQSAANQQRDSSCGCNLGERKFPFPASPNRRPVRNPPPHRSIQCEYGDFMIIIFVKITGKLRRWTHQTAVVRAPPAQRAISLCLRPEVREADLQPPGIGGNVGSSLQFVGWPIE